MQQFFLSAFIVSSLCLFSGLYATAQQKDGQSGFSVTYLSSDIKVDALKLQQKIKSAASLEEVKKIVSSEINSTSGYITVRFREGKNYYWWKRQFAKDKSDAAQWIILAKRDMNNVVINELNGFREIFNRKLVIFDTLAVYPVLKNPAFPVGSYRFRSKCSKTEKEITFPSTKNDRLLIFPKLFADCAKDSVAFRLFNNSAPRLTLAEGTFVFVNADMEKEFLAVVNTIRQTMPAISENDLADYLRGYISAFYGEVTAQQHKTWLSKNRRS